MARLHQQKAARCVLIACPDLSAPRKDRWCRRREVGHCEFNCGEQVVCTACTPGTYAENASAAACTEVVAHVCIAYRYQLHATQCKPGRYQAGSGGHECLPCWLGSYAASSRASTCLPCPGVVPVTADGCSDCPAGTRVKRQDDDQQCEACSPGLMSSTANADACGACPDGSVVGAQQRAPVHFGNPRSFS